MTKSEGFNSVKSDSSPEKYFISKLLIIKFLHDFSTLIKKTHVRHFNLYRESQEVINPSISSLCRLFTTLDRIKLVLIVNFYQNIKQIIIFIIFDTQNNAITVVTRYI